MGAWMDMARDMEAQRRYRDAQEEQRRAKEEEHQRVLLEQLTQGTDKLPGLSGKDLMGLSGSFGAVPPHDFAFHVKIADMMRKREREQAQLQETMDPKMLSTLGAMAAQRQSPGGITAANPTGTVPPPAEARSFANEAITNRVAALRNLSLPPEVQQQYQNQMMNTFSTSRMGTTAAEQNLIAEDTRKSNLAVSQNERISNSAQSIRAEEQAKEDAASEVAWAIYNKDTSVGSTTADLRARLAEALPGVAPVKLDRLAAQTKLRVAGMNRDIQTWDRSVTGKAIDKEAIAAQVQGYIDEGFKIMPAADELLRQATMEATNHAAVDPVFTRDSALVFSRVGIFDAKSKAKFVAKREDLADLVAMQERFVSIYQDASVEAKSGKLGGGPLRTAKMINVATFLGASAPNTQLYVSEQFNYAMALLRAWRQGRVSDQDMERQLATLPAVWEIGTPTGDLKIAARNIMLQDMKYSIYTPEKADRIRGAIGEVKLKDRALETVKLSASTRAKLSALRNAEDLVPDDVWELMDSASKDKAGRAVVGPAVDEKDQKLLDRYPVGP